MPSLPDDKNATTFDLRDFVLGHRHSRHACSRTVQPAAQNRLANFDQCLTATYYRGHYRARSRYAFSIQTLMPLKFSFLDYHWLLHFLILQTRFVALPTLTCRAGGVLDDQTWKHCVQTLEARTPPKRAQGFSFGAHGCPLGPLLPRCTVHRDLPS